VFLGDARRREAFHSTATLDQGGQENQDNHQDSPRTLASVLGPDLGSRGSRFDGIFKRVAIHPRRLDVLNELPL